MGVARGRAAEVLRTARKRPDERMLGGTASGAERTSTGQERSRDDEALRREYALADEVAADQRAERTRLVAELLAQERQDTKCLRSCGLARKPAKAGMQRGPGPLTGHYLSLRVVSAGDQECSPTVRKVRQPAEIMRFCRVGAERIELSTNGLRVRCSAN